jgi:fructose-1,6-bisphosphatase/sedoheptulose 1,7-bisphosphatase-like protein
MNSDLSLDFLRVVEQAAIACAHTMGQGDRHKSDQAAVEAMRESLDTVPIEGTIVIGEGERDKAPMLYIGEKVGMGARQKLPFGIEFPAVDIAVDPLEGTNRAPSARRTRSWCWRHDRGGLLHAPDLYMEKLVVGPNAKGRSARMCRRRELLRCARALPDRRVEDLVVMSSKAAA